jgi:TPP-dependent pyruvate/acetoin dehydrogenase alpha subunit
MHLGSDIDERNARGPRRPYPVQPFKDKEFSLSFFRLMVRARVLEERLIKMARTGDGFFWIGGPGEEAFNIALGLLAEKGQGPEHDILHLHYRNNGVLLAMGASMIDFVRQMRSSMTDPFSGGRNFVSHIAKKEWNIMPVTSTIETQFAVAPGTAMDRVVTLAKGQGRLFRKGYTVVLARADHLPKTRYPVTCGIAAFAECRGIGSQGQVYATP